MSILYGSATSYKPQKKELNLQDTLNLAIKYHQSGNLNEAKVNYEKILKVDKNNFNALNLLGVLFYQIGKNNLAIEYINKAITINPNYVDCYYNLALAYQAKNLIDEAIVSYKKVIELNPNNLTAYDALGNIYEQKKDFNKAIEYYERVIALNPNFKTYNNLGNIYKELKNLDKAIYYFELAIKLNSTIAEIYYNLANTQKELNLIDEAIKNYQKAIELNPSYVEAYNNLAILLDKKSLIDEAIKNYQKAIELNPNYMEAYVSLSTSLLSIGDFKNGFEYYKYRYSNERDINHRIILQQVDIPYWNGENLQNKTILLLREQGLGDEIFFLRFAKKLKERGVKIIYNPAHKIKSIISRCEEIDETINDNELTKIKADFSLPIGDLPFLLDSKVVEPLKLSPLEDRVKELKKELVNSNKPLIALTYRAGINKEKFLFKSIDLKLLIDKLKNIDANFIIIQREATKEEIEFLKENLTIYDFTHLNDDLEGMLALLSLVDDYISVSNTNIHLYASFNKSAKVLVPNPPEWRWMREKSSFWFKNFNIYRQEIDGNWNKALNKLIEDLKI